MGWGNRTCVWGSLVTKYKLRCSSPESSGFSFFLMEQSYSPGSCWPRCWRDSCTVTPGSLKTSALYVVLMPVSMMVTEASVHCATYVHHPGFQGHSRTSDNWILMVEVTLMCWNLWNFPYSKRRKMAQAGIKLQFHVPLAVILGHYCFFMETWLNQYVVTPDRWFLLFKITSCWKDQQVRLILHFYVLHL